MNRRIAPVLIILALVAAACAQRDAILSRTATGLDAALSAMTASDERLQREILTDARKAFPDDNVKANALAIKHTTTYRETYVKVLLAIETAQAAVFAASLDPPAEAAMANMIAAATAAFALFNDFRTVIK